MSDVLEKSLDEIIGEDKAEISRSYRGRGERGERGRRRHEFRDHSRERVPRDRKDFRERDRYEPPRQTKIQRLSGGKAYLKITNLHYDITKDDLEQLFNTVGETSFVDIEFKSGRSSGIAYVGFKDIRLNRDAVDKFDGRKAVGQHITVEEIKPLTIGLAPRSRERSSFRGGRDRGSLRRQRTPRPKKPTTEDLDKELEDYMNRDGAETKQSEPSTNDLDKELDDYMNKPFPAAS